MKSNKLKYRYSIDVDEINKFLSINQLSDVDKIYDCIKKVPKLSEEDIDDRNDGVYYNDLQLFSTKLEAKINLLIQVILNLDKVLIKYQDKLDKLYKVTK